MSEENGPEASVLQEAIDTLVSEFGYPDSITLEIRSDSSKRETLIDVHREDQTDSYKLQFDGSDDAQEPEIELILP